VSKGSWKLSAETRRKIGEKTSERYRRARLDALAEPDHKRCSKCEVVKPLGDFHVRKYEIKDGWREGPEARCKACKYADYKRWRERKREEGVDLYALWLRYNRKGRTAKGKKERRRRERERLAIRRREEGRPIRGPRDGTHLQDRDVSTAPIADYLRGKGLSEDSIAAQTGVGDRRIGSILREESKTVRLSTVDKILIGLDAPYMLHELYPED
jgi:hypothetical protein